MSEYSTLSQEEVTWIKQFMLSGKYAEDDWEKLEVLLLRHSLYVPSVPSLPKNPGFEQDDGYFCLDGKMLAFTNLADLRKLFARIMPGRNVEHQAVPYVDLTLKALIHKKDILIDVTGIPGAYILRYYSKTYTIGVDKLVFYWE